MGWTFIDGATRGTVVFELTTPESSLRTLRHCCRGNVLYALHESVVQGSSMKWIGIYLMQRSSEGWGYKSMDESMHPFYYNCPLSYLDEADEPANESAKAWRDRVREQAAATALQNAKRPKEGEEWSCLGKNCKRIRIAKVLGRRIEAYDLTGGGYYRIPKKMLGERLSEVKDE